MQRPVEAPQQSGGAAIKLGRILVSGLVREMPFAQRSMPLEYRDN